MSQRVRQRQSVVYVRSYVGIDPDSHGDRSLNGLVHISETSLPMGQIAYESGPMGGASVSRVLEPATGLLSPRPLIRHRVRYQHV
jgi:hypothetical protein